MFRPSDLRKIFSGFKVKKAMFEFMQWYFRPRTSYEPERVDYNALNILAEYQTYNLEFLKNELEASDEQAANVLEGLWSLLEFDPDEKSVEREHGGGDVRRPEHQENNIAYLGDDMIDQEEEAFKTLLSGKFGRFRKLLCGMLDHECEAARITIEQARRISVYVSETYFRHLRLYDFVLKNTKLSEVKRVFIPVVEPCCGDELSTAMVLADDSIKVPTIVPQRQQSGPFSNSGHDTSGAELNASQMEGTIVRDGQTIAANTEQEANSATDSDMDEVLRTTGIERQTKNKIHRVTRDWDNKIAAAVTRDVKTDNNPMSGAKKR